MAYLLLYGTLPTRTELAVYIDRLISLRGLPDELKTVLEMIPADAHPMDVSAHRRFFPWQHRAGRRDFSRQEVLRTDCWPACRR